MSGSRKRYLSEQEAFMAEKFGMDVSKAARPARVMGYGRREPVLVRNGLSREPVNLDDPIAKGDRRATSSATSAATFAAPGALFAAGSSQGGYSRGARRGLYAAGAGAVIGGAAGAAFHKDPRHTRQGGLDYRTTSGVTPLTSSRRNGYPVPIPGRSVQTDIYRGKKHVGFIDAQQALHRPHDMHMVNAYVDAAHRGKGIGPRAIDHTAAYAGRTQSASGHRSPMGDKLAARYGHAPANSKDRDDVTGHMNESWQDRQKHLNKPLKTDKRGRVLKADYAPLKTNMSESDAKRVVGRVNLAGPLPKHYTREQKMGAYEARYVSAGGRKGEKWQHRASAGDKAKTAGLAVATAGGAGILASRTKAVSRLKNVTQIRHAADTAALTGATAGGAAELYAGRARRKRASYSSAPGGAAASALRRMRSMDEARGQS